eukprot:m.72925 g.72925  ORF g.72925 m.72925 type:complete len:595 (+) comp11762_c0_seq2:56-1840(+)
MGKERSDADLKGKTTKIKEDEKDLNSFSIEGGRNKSFTTTTLVGSSSDEKSDKKRRTKRKPNVGGGKIKGKAKKLLQPLTFYFSDANLRKDRFILATMQKDPNGYFPVKLFLKFNKVKQITQQIKDVIKAIKHLDHLELSPDERKVRRRNPEIAEKDVDACSIYVENIPPTFEHAELEAIFGEFGAVEYVSLPRWKNHKHKGFAFIEFSSPAEAEAACDRFSEEPVSDIPAASQCWRGPILPSLDADKVLGSGVVYKNNTHFDQQPQNPTETTAEEDVSTPKGTEEKVEGDPGLAFRVLPKQVFIEKKKEYKQLQRQYISTLKQTQYQQYYDDNVYNCNVDDELQHQQQHEQHVHEKKDEEEEEFDVSSVVRGVVVCAENLPLGITKQQLKKHFLQRSSLDATAISYLDFVPGAAFCHVRVGDVVSARVLAMSEGIEDDADLWGTLTLRRLEGEEETEYWRKIHKSKIAQRLKRQKKNKKKGRRKYLERECANPQHAPTTADTSFHDMTRQQQQQQQIEEKAGTQGKTDTIAKTAAKKKKSKSKRVHIKFSDCDGAADDATDGINDHKRAHHNDDNDNSGEVTRKKPKRNELSK